MKFAIIQTSGTQYRVAEGDTITVDQVDSPEKKEITFSEVLLMSDENSFLLGRPHVTGAKVKGEVLAHKKGKKIRVATYRAKSRSRHVYGHRSLLTDVKITKILSADK